MKSPRRVWTLIAVLAVVIVAVAVWSLASLRPPVRSATRLADGTLLTLEDVTYGREHALVKGAGWQKALAKLFPPLKERLVIEYSRTLSQHPEAVTFWVVRTGAPAGSYWDVRGAALDEHGCETEPTGGVTNSDGPGREVHGFTLNVFPRRSRTVGVRVYQRDPQSNRWRRLAEYSVPNPYRRSYPTWSPEPVPATKPNGDLSVTLTRLVTGAGPGTPPRKPQPGEEIWSNARFRVVQNGKPSTDWQPREVEVSDATGNRFTSSANTYGQDGDSRGSMHLGWRGSLWPDEPAWKLRFEFSRRAGFAPDELWTLNGLVLPQKGKTLKVAQRAVRQGLPVELVALSRGGAPPDGFSSFSEGAGVHLSAPSVRPGTRITLVRVTDERGRPVKQGGSGWGGGQFSFGLEPPADAKRLNLTFAIHKSRYVEFLAAPTRL